MRKGKIFPILKYNIINNFNINIKLVLTLKHVIVYRYTK
jgi:hypothetical protein